MDNITKQDRENMWVSRFRALADSGLTQKAWCEKNGVALSTLRYWIRKLRMTETKEDAPASGWLALDAPQSNAKDKADDAASGEIRISSSGVTVVLPEGIDIAAASMYIKLLADL